MKPIVSQGNRLRSKTNFYGIKELTSTIKKKIHLRKLQNEWDILGFKKGFPRKRTRLRAEERGRIKKTKSRVREDGSNSDHIQKNQSI
jgi:hypothetical protein